jgi:CcmD family protein
LVLTLALVLAGSMASYAGAAEVRASDHQAGTPTQLQEEAPQQSDEMDGESELPWLFAVFIITWAAFFAYVFIMSRRQREMQREIDVLKRSLNDREAADKNDEGLTGG